MGTPARRRIIRVTKPGPKRSQGVGGVKRRVSQRKRTMKRRQGRSS